MDGVENGNELRGACVLHLDLDCFYAQVEIDRLGLDPAHPTAVQQWESLIAVNYPARKCGITRHLRAREAKALCPELTLVHVETIDEEGQSRPEAKRASDKVSLERYRRASASIFDVFVRMLGESRVEKAGLDEAFLDVTDLVDAALAAAPSRPETGQDNGAGGSGAGSLRASLSAADAAAPFPANDVERAWYVEGGTLTPDSREDDKRMLLASRVAHRVRMAVWDTLRFRCSAGVAGNKTLAKLASPKNKPDGLALIPRRAVAGLMRSLPLSSIRFLGGKLGRRLAASGLETAAHLQARSEDSLRSEYGDRTGAWLFRICRGVDNDPVKPRTVPKSMLACKSFAACPPGPALQRWLRVLVHEVVERMADDRRQFARVPRTLTLAFSCNAGYRARSRSCPIPPSRSHDALLQAATGLLRRAVEELRTSAPNASLRFTRLQLSAGAFTEAPQEGRTAITSFFAARAAGGPPASDDTGQPAAPRRVAGQGGEQPPSASGSDGQSAPRVEGDHSAPPTAAPAPPTRTAPAAPAPSIATAIAAAAAAPASSRGAPKERVEAPCPICGASLRGSEAAATRHVEACLAAPAGKRARGPRQPSVRAMFQAGRYVLGR